MSKIDTIILAGGLGTRLSGVVSDRPKVLAPVNGRPFLDILLEGLNSCSAIGNVILAVGHMAEKVIETYAGKTGYSFGIKFSTEKKSLGTGGGIKKALSLVETERVFVLNGDSFVDADLCALARFHEKKKALFTVVLAKAENADRFGRVLCDSEGRIVSFLEKKLGAGAGLINAGVYLLEKGLFDDVPLEVPLSLERDLMPLFIQKSVYGFATEGKFIDMGTPESYERASLFFRGKKG